MSKFSTNLRRLRQHESLTQKALANKLNVSNSTISNWEKGLTEPDIAMLKVIAQFFSVTVDSLLGDNPKPNQTKPTNKTVEIIRVKPLNTVKDPTFYGLNALFLVMIVIGFITNHSIVIGFLSLSLLLLLIYGITLLFKPHHERLIEGTLHEDERLIYEHPKDGKDKLILMSFGKFLLSTFTIIYGFILILSSYQTSPNDDLILGLVVFMLILSYLLLFIYVYPLFTSKKDLDFNQTPKGFNLWVLTLIHLVDFMILLIPSIAFIFHETRLFDLAFPMQIIPILLIGNYSISYFYKKRFIDYFKQFKLIKLNRKTNHKKVF